MKNNNVQRVNSGRFASTFTGGDEMQTLLPILQAHFANMILVTGGTGLIGSQIISDLAAMGKKVRALKRNGADMKCAQRISKDQNISSQVEWFEGDIRDIFSVEEMMTGIKQVYHSAALVSFNPADFREMIEINTTGTANMVNMALKCGVEHFCFISSAAALGKAIPGMETDEKATWKAGKDNSGYAISKYGAEREVWRAMEEGLPAFILNPTVVIGPGKWTSGSSQMFSRLDKNFPFYPPGETGFVDVRDVSKCAIELMTLRTVNERFIVSAVNASYKKVFGLITRCLDRPEPSIRVPPFLGKIGWRIEKIKSLIMGTSPMITKETTRSGFSISHFSNKKIKSHLGIEFIPLEKSIADTCMIYKSETRKPDL